MRILIAVPTFETITPDTFKSIYDLDKGGHECLFEFVRGYDCAAARNYIAQRAIDLEADYVLMVDNDITLPRDALVNLLEEGKEVCLGFYAHRSAQNLYSGKTSVFREGEFNYTMHFPSLELQARKAEGKHKIRVHGGGMGCALIKTEVFKKIKYPWYAWVTYLDGQYISEDLYFCEECRKAGIPIYTDTRVGCGHLFRRTQWPV